MPRGSGIGLLVVDITGFPRDNDGDDDEQDIIVPSTKFGGICGGMDKV